MKKSKILDWILDNNINPILLQRINVPEEGDEEYQQNEEWWIDIFGATPSAPVMPGKYFYFYASRVVADELEYDAQIEVCNEDTMFGYDYINFIRIEEE